MEWKSSRPFNILVPPVVVKAAEICSLQSQKRELKRLISFGGGAADWRIFLCFLLSSQWWSSHSIQRDREKKELFFFGGQEKKTNEGADRKRSVHGFAWIVEKTPDAAGRQGAEKNDPDLNQLQCTYNARNMEFLASSHKWVVWSWSVECTGWTSYIFHSSHSVGKSLKKSYFATK